MTAFGRVAASLAAAILLAQPAAAQDAFADARRRMVDGIRQLDAAGAMPGVGRVNPGVTTVLADVPRHLFVPEELRSEAYRDEALPIGHDSTISQPFVVAVMTDLLDVEPAHRVLEVGTGSGYQAAVLSRLAGQVFSIEIVPELAQSATQRLQALGYRSVKVRAGDGYQGWPEEAPFDRILVTAGATHVPEPLVRQLAPGGRLVIPVGPRRGTQSLVLVTKDARGRVRSRRLGPVVFIPLAEPAR